MIKSMTGFGRGEHDDGVHKFVIEIKALNHRFNDIIIKVPKHISYVEEDIKKAIMKDVSRGRIEVYVNLEYIGEPDIYVHPNLELAKSYKDALEKINNELDINENVDLNLLCSFPEVLKVEKREENKNEIWECLEVALDEAINNMMDMRINEGIELAKDIKTKSENILKMVKKIEERSDLVVIEYQEKLGERIKELLKDEIVLDENKLANEVAFFADKSNINEEIVRLYSHINQLITSLKSDESIGRKLDFLIQEMNREINTIGSKTSDLEICNYVIEVKSELEKIREQVQNVE